MSPKESREVGFFLDKGLQFGISIILGFFAGWWVDKKTNMLPLFMVIGIFFGAIAGFYNLYKNLMAYNKKNDKE